jgi:hypothetical protein
VAGQKKNESDLGATAGSAENIDPAATPKASAQEPLFSQAPSRVPSFTTLLVPSQVSSNASSRPTSHASRHSRPISPHRTSSSSTNVPQIGAVEAPPTANDNRQPFPSTIYTPHDRGHYLAYSAPGSRNASVDNTPFVSRAVSPTHQHGLSVRGHGSGSLRPIASTSRLNQLLAAEGIRRSMSPLADVAEGGKVYRHQPEGQEEDIVANLSVSQGWMHPDDISAFVETVSRRPSPSRPSSRSRTPSRFRSRSPRTTSPDHDEAEGGGGLYLHGLGHPDVIRDDAASRAQTRDNSPFRAPSYQSVESAAYLRGLAQRHFEMVNAASGSGSNTPTVQESPGHPATGSHHEPWSRITQHPVGQAPVSPRGGASYAPSQQRETAPTAFAFPATRKPDTTSFPAFIDPVPPPSYIAHAEKKPLNTGRPRAASKALNEAYNAANPSSTPRPIVSFLVSDEQTETGNVDTEIPSFTARCPIHSESCNGQYVVHSHITERARNGAGFKDLFPTIQCDDGRVMVDWAKMRDEELERLRA